jgi:hypothetical protein
VSWGECRLKKFVPLLPPGTEAEAGKFGSATVSVSGSVCSGQWRTRADNNLDAGEKAVSHGANGRVGPGETGRQHRDFASSRVFANMFPDGGNGRGLY